MDELDLGATIRGFSPGQKLFGRYTLKKQLGRGGMGVVWQARDESLEQDVAIKLLPEMVATDPVSIRELKRETRRSQALAHPHILKVHDFVEGGGLCGISMELVEGGTLSARRLEEARETFTPAQLGPWVRQLCEALDYAHKKAKVVHRDLKPANLMLTPEGDLKVADFGIAASLSESVTRVSKQAGSSGTPLYMSPQQMMGDDPAVTDDLYALGATLYELLTGKPPFFSGNVLMQVQSKVPVTVNERLRANGHEGEPVPAEWEETIAACLAKEPKDRPQSAGEVAERLGLVSGSNVQRSTRVPKVEAVAPNGPSANSSTTSTAQTPNPKSKTQSRTPLVAALVAGVILAAGLGWYFGIHVPAQKEKEKEKERLAQIALEESWGRAASQAGEKFGIDEKGDIPSAAAQSEPQQAKVAAAKLKVAVFAKNWAAEVDGAFGLLAEALRAEGTALSIEVKNTGATLRGSNPGTPDQTSAVVSMLTEQLRDSELTRHLGYERVELLSVNRDTQTGLLAWEIRFTREDWIHDRSVKPWPVAMNAADEPAYMLKANVAGLAPGALAEVAGLTPDRLIRPGELAVNLQRFYRLETVTGIKLTDLRQGTVEAVAPLDALDSVPFQVSAEGTQAALTRFMAAVQSGEKIMQVRDFSLVEIARPAMAAPAPPKSARSDRELLRMLAEQLSPSGYFVLGGKPTLIFGQKRVVVGDSLLTSFENQTYSPVVSAIDGTSYTLRLNNEALTRPIKAGDAPATMASQPTVSAQSPPQPGQPWENTLGQKFVPVPGTGVLFCIWETRVQDFAAFAQATRSEWSNSGEPSHPVVNVSWDEAQAFCAWLTQHEQAAGRLGPDQKYRLPTDAEWSLTVGLTNEGNGTPESKDAQIQGVYPWGPQWPPPSGVGNYTASLKVDSFEGTAPVGSFAANRHGIYDLGGNVWEWCEDFYNGSSGNRVLRGASYLGFGNSGNLLSSDRGNGAPDFRGGGIGFRVVMAPGSYSR